MQLEVILFCAIGIWFLVVLMCVSLCKAAKAGDEAMEEAYQAAAEEWSAAAPSISVRKLVLVEAAAELGVSPQTLLTWEERFGYPRSSPSVAGGFRLYRQSEVLALRDALAHGLSIASAVNNARATTTRRRRVSA